MMNTFVVNVCIKLHNFLESLKHLSLFICINNKLCIAIYYVCILMDKTIKVAISGGKFSWTSAAVQKYCYAS